MGLTKGGGPEAMSFLTKGGKRLEKELSSQLLQGLRVGATPSEEGGALSAEETEAFDAVVKGFRLAQGELTGEDYLGFIAEQLSGRPSTEITDATTQEFFEKSIAAPLKKYYIEQVIPQISRAYRGLTTRRADAIRRSFDTFSDTLSARFAELKFADETARRTLIESAKARQQVAIQVAPALYGAGFQSALAFGLAASDIRARSTEEERRLRPENNPFFGMAQSFLGTPTQQIVDVPAKMTGFGQALATGQAIADIGVSVGGAMSGVGGGIKALKGAFGTQKEVA